MPGLLRMTWVVMVILLCLILIGRASRWDDDDDDDEEEEEVQLPKLTISTVLRITAFFQRRFRSKVVRSIFNYKHNYDYQVNRHYELSWQMRSLGHYSPKEILSNLCEFILKEQISTLLYLSNSDHMGDHTAAGQYLMQVANFLGIPVLAWNGDNPGFFQPTGSFRILQLAPSISHQCRAMLALLQRYQWPAFSIVTGSMAGETHFISILRDLVDEIEDRHINIDAVVQISRPDPKVIASQLQKLVIEETRVIFIYASKKESQQIMSVAGSMGLTDKDYLWVVSQSIVGDISDDPAAPEEFPVGVLGMYFLNNPNALADAIEQGTSIWVNGVEKLIRDQESGVVDDFSLIPNLNCSSANMSEWTTPHWKNGDILFEYLKKSSGGDEYDGNATSVFNDDGTIKDSELRIVNLNNDHEWEEIGGWTSSGGLAIDDITWPGNSPSPPSGRPAKYHLKVVTLKEPPYVNYIDPDPATGLCPPMAVSCRITPVGNDSSPFPDGPANATVPKCCSGLCIDLLKMLGEKIQFEFDIFEVDDRKWGAYDNKKKEWNGLIRTLMDGKADLCMTSLKITPERNEQVEFSVPFLETGITIIVAVRDGVISPTAFLEPYDYPSWCLILVFSVHASGAAIFIFEWLSPSGLNRGDKPIREHRFSLFRSFWLIWAMLFGAAVNTDNPRGMSSRFMANIWALFAVVFTASYTANLAAFMITKEDYDKLTGIQDWRLMNPTARKPPFKFATVPHGSTETNLMKNFPEMYNYMKPYNKTSVEEGVQGVKEQDINAFLYDATVLDFLAGQDDGCKLRTVGNWYAMTGYGVAFPQGSKWIDVFNKFLVEFQNNGEMERLQKFWLAGACTKQKVDGESSMPLGILNFTSAFILLAGGMLLGALLLLLEHVYFKFFRHKLRKWDRCGCCGLVSLSMGKSLTFEQSVREALDLQKNFKCKNPICETHIWKVKHELDLALLKIDRMQKQLTDNGISRDQRAVWRDNDDRPPPAIGWHPDAMYADTPPDTKPTARPSSNNAYDKHTPAVPSALSNYSIPTAPDNYPPPGGYPTLPPDTYPCKLASEPYTAYPDVTPAPRNELPVYHEDMYRQQPCPPEYPSISTPASRPTSGGDIGNHYVTPAHVDMLQAQAPDGSSYPTKHAPKSRSVPTSPVRYPPPADYKDPGYEASPVWQETPRTQPPAYDADTPLLDSDSPGLQRSLSSGEKLNPDELTNGGRKTRKHRGNKYVQVRPDGPAGNNTTEKRKSTGSRDGRLGEVDDESGDEVEKETVL